MQDLDLDDFMPDKYLAVEAMEKPFTGSVLPSVTDTQVRI